MTKILLRQKEVCVYVCVRGEGEGVIALSILQAVLFGDASVESKTNQFYDIGYCLSFYTNYKLMTDVRNNDLDYRALSITYQNMINFSLKHSAVG